MSHCSSCSVVLSKVYIKCEQCFPPSRDIFICIFCFAKGKEFGVHKNNHRYSLVQNQFDLFDSNWSAHDTLTLVYHLERFGHGNWSDCTIVLPNKSAVECRDYYNKHFIENPSDELNFLSDSCVPKSELYRYPHITGLDPPRPVYGSKLYRQLAGYNAARSDFEIEWDDKAEEILNDVDATSFYEDEGSLEKALVMNVTDIYQRKLQERRRRKQIVKEHGLLNHNETQKRLQYCKSSYSKLVAILPKFFQLLSSDNISYLIEGFQLANEVRTHIKRLQEYRENGIRYPCVVTIYETLKAQRSNLNKKKKLLESKSQLNVMHKMTRNSRHNLPLKKTVNMDISKKPGFSKLMEEEKILLEEIQVLPKKYMQYKQKLIKECVKNNGLSFTKATSLLRIHKERTEKIYNYLMTIGLLHTDT